MDNISWPNSVHTREVLTWNYPPPPSEAIQNFLVTLEQTSSRRSLINCYIPQVTYSADVEWSSPEGVLVLFKDSGEATATTNRIKVSALIPGTTYQFRVSAVTQSGRGAEVGIVGQTQYSQGTK